MTSTSRHPKIPEHAKCVFRGVIFDIYQWQQEMYDGTTATFELAVRPSTVVVIPVSGETVYYAEQEQPGKPAFLSLFGGRIDPGETPEQTAQRELMEEAGLTAESIEPYFVHSILGKITWNIHYFIARDCVKIAEQNLDGGEKITVKTTSIDQFIADVVMDPRFSELELKQRITRGSICDTAATQMLKELRG